MLAVFALTLFTSATLLMVVQPIIGKMITPLLGGTPAVWNTCMVFFQAVLLAGYAYAHSTTTWLGTRKQALMHLAILVIPFGFFPLAVNEELIQGHLDNPIPPLLLLLVTSVGVPFFVVSTSAPLLQKWFSSTTHPEARDPYFLYGASNLGSMIALLSYPSILEPYLRNHPWWWMVVYTVLVLLIGGGCAAFLWTSPAAKPEPDPDTVKADAPALALASVAAPSQSIQPASAKVGVTRGRGKKNRRGDRGGRDWEREESQEQPLPAELDARVTWLRRLRWVLLAAVPSSLMLGATTYMTTDIAALPLLWVLPLALYLMTFILVFAKISPLGQSVVVFSALQIAGVFLIWIGVAYTSLNEGVIFLLRIMILAGCLAAFAILRWRRTDLIQVCCIGALPLILLLLVFMMLSDIKPAKIAMTIGIHLLTLFIVAMVCHGELARDRPTPKHLTEFFLWMSFGGVVGGVFNALVAPLIFDAIVEYQLAMVVACLLLPALGMGIDAEWGSYLDLALVALCLTIGTVLIGCRLWQNDINFERGAHWSFVTYLWVGVAVVLMFGLGLFTLVRYRDGAPRRWFREVVLPIALLVAVLGLNLLGLLIVYQMSLSSGGHQAAPTASGTGVGWVAVILLALTWLSIKGCMGYYRYHANRKIPGILIVAAVAVNLLVLLEASVLSVAWRSGEGFGVLGWLAFLIAACAAVNAGFVYCLYLLRLSYQRLQVVIDVAMPFAVLLMVTGLIWGMSTALLYYPVGRFSQAIGQNYSQIRVILTFGVPAVLCYTFAERSIRFGMCVGALILASVFTGLFEGDIIYQERSFFGVLRVEEDKSDRSRRLVHGTTLHGKQYVLPADPVDREKFLQNYPGMRDADTWPLTYYDHTGPIGQLFEAYNSPKEEERIKEKKNNIGVIGLGTGTMACYSEPGQHLTFYDIDPVVRRITWEKQYFTFVQQARDRGVVVHDLEMGDARLKLKRKQMAEDEKYGFLIVDAFSSDAIPIHLITYQALEMYWDKMAENGIIVFHISNRYLNLKPVLGNLVAKYTREKSPLFGYYMEDGDGPFGKTASTWVVIARDSKYLERLGLYESWDAKMGLDTSNPCVTLEQRAQRYRAMQLKVAPALQQMEDEKEKDLRWDDVRPTLAWDDARRKLHIVGVQPSVYVRLLNLKPAVEEPQWIPLPLRPDKGEWTDEYAPLLKVFRW
jgi:hypothetical protein